MLIIMLKVLIDNIFVAFEETIFQQTVGIPMGTNCSQLLSDIHVFHIHTKQSPPTLLSTGRKHFESQFNVGIDK